MSESRQNIFKLLGEFSSLRKEIKETQARIAQLEKSNKLYASDVVKGSGKNYPYISHTVKVAGVADFSGKIEEQNKVLQKRLIKLQGLISELQKIIDGIEDSEVRRIMQFRYVDGKTYKQVAQAMGCAGDGSTQLKQMRIYLRKNFLKN